MPLTTTATKAPTGLVSVDGRTFPLRATRIEGRAQGGLATTTLVQEYANPHALPLEVLYTMPLPADGAVVAYTIHLGKRIVQGEVRRRDEARDAYRKALAEGRTAGLLEQDRADTFTQSLGNLPAGCDVRVEIEVLQPLAFRVPSGSNEEPAWEYRFPTVTGVRYSGGEGRVEDADALEPPRADELGTPVRLEVDLLVADGAATGLRSSSHAIAVTSESETSRILLSAPARLDRDFVLCWPAARGTVGLALSQGAGLAGDAGRYGLLTITPPSRPETAFARDLTVLLDASGSMSGEPIRQAVALVEELLASLDPGDRFELLAFSNTVRDLTSGPIDASKENIAAAILRLRATSAGGGTEMATALLRALTSLREDSQRQVVLVTDGQVGFEQEVVREVLEKLPAGARLHVVGIGAAPNRTLTRGASRAGRGAELLVAPGDDARIGASRLCRAMTAPILTDLSIRGTAVAHVAPERPSDVFAGRPLLVALEIAPAGGAIEVEGCLAGSRERWRERIEIGAACASDARATLPLGAFFGRERVEDAEMRLAAAYPAQRAAVEEEIAGIALRHRIVSRATSLVAISEDPTVDPRDPRRRERIAAEIPAGVSAEAVGYGVPLEVLGLLRQEMKSGNLDLVVRAMQASGTSVSDEPVSIEFALSRNELFGSRTDRLGRLGPVNRETLGRIVGVEADILLVEAEVPAEGLEIPGDGASISVTLADGVSVGGRVVGARSTRPGRHEPGLTVRLALRLEGGRSGRDAKVLLWILGQEVFLIVLAPSEGG